MNGGAQRGALMVLTMRWKRWNPSMPVALHHLERSHGWGGVAVALIPAPAPGSPTTPSAAAWQTRVTRRTHLPGLHHLLGALSARGSPQLWGDTLIQAPPEGREATAPCGLEGPGRSGPGRPEPRPLSGQS